MRSRCGCGVGVHSWATIPVPLIAAGSLGTERVRYCPFSLRRETPLYMEAYILHGNLSALPLAWII